MLALSGLLVALTIRHLPGTAGHKPAEGFKTGGPVRPIDLPGIIIAAFATLSLGVVLGPEAPLIAIGSGLGVLAVHLIKRDAPEMASVVIGAAGSFAAISTLLGSPLAGAFLLMEAGGLGGALMGVVLVPGLLAAGIGSLIYVGLDDWTGLRDVLARGPEHPTRREPDGRGVPLGDRDRRAGRDRRQLHQAAGARAAADRRAADADPHPGSPASRSASWSSSSSRRRTSRRPIVLFSGQDQLAPLIDGAASWTVGALLLLFLCKGLAYSFALSGFRGGPVFPGMFLGAVGGIALSHLPGLPMIAGAAMGIGAMTVAMLGLPLVSVLLVMLFLQADGLALTPLVIVAVVVSYVVSARLMPAPGAARAEADPAAAG